MMAKRVETSRLRYAWYSQNMRERFGYAVYRRDDGSTVEVTSVTEAPDSGLGFDDVEARGLVLSVEAGGFVSCVNTPRMDQLLGR